MSCYTPSKAVDTALVGMARGGLVQTPTPMRKGRLAPSKIHLETVTLFTPSFSPSPSLRHAFFQRKTTNGRCTFIVMLEMKEAWKFLDLDGWSEIVVISRSGSGLTYCVT